MQRLIPKAKMVRIMLSAIGASSAMPEKGILPIITLTTMAIAANTVKITPIIPPTLNPSAKPSNGEMKEIGLAFLWP